MLEGPRTHTTEGSQDKKSPGQAFEHTLENSPGEISRVLAAVTWGVAAGVIKHMTGREKLAGVLESIPKVIGKAETAYESLNGLTDAMTEQQFRETIVAYNNLIKNASPAEAAELTDERDRISEKYRNKKGGEQKSRQAVSALLFGLLK